MNSGSSSTKVVASQAVKEGVEEADLGSATPAHSSLFIPNLNQIRKREFARWQGHVYLDNAGAALYSSVQVEEYARALSLAALGNPHYAVTSVRGEIVTIGGGWGADTQSPASKASTAQVEAIRDQILAFFGTSRQDYTVIFTSGATGALRLLGEAFPWSKGSRYVYTSDSSHTSAVGVRNSALARGAEFGTVGVVSALAQLRSYAETAHTNAGSATSTYNLFSIPAQCNFSGQKYVTEATEIVERLATAPPTFAWTLDSSSSPQSNTNSTTNNKWLSLLDAASLVSTSPLSLGKIRADFVCLSFYKIFGFPTGLGCLLVRTQVAGVLEKEKKYFGGGTVAATLANQNYVQFRSNSIAAKFEDGTVDYLGIMAIRQGLELVCSTLGGMETIARHTSSLTRQLVKGLGGLRHYTGAPVAEIYNAEHLQAAMDAKEEEEFGRIQGPIVAFNLVNAQGEYIGYSEVQRLASLAHIHLRTGCFCNPGACQRFLKQTNSDIQSNFAHGHVCWDETDSIRGRPTGAVRVSVPAIASIQDIQRFVDFVKIHFVEEAPLPVQPRSTTRSTSATVSRLVVYPIKSCGGFEVDRWPIGPEGFEYDREWTLIDAQQRKFVNQKQIPHLCFIQPTIDLDTNKMTLTAPGILDQSLVVDLKDRPRQTMPVEVCGELKEAFIYDTEVNEWFNAFLREVSAGGNFPPNPPVVLARKSQSAFVNEGQFLLVSQESIDEVNKRIADRIKTSEAPFVTYRNFRPNIVLSGVSYAFEEDRYRRVRLESLEFAFDNLCNRCSMVCVDPITGKNSSEPLLSLSKFRRAPKSTACPFGILVSHVPSANAAGGGKLSIGSALTVVELSPA